jgi:sugar lactone lactonase YvrE
VVNSQVFEPKFHEIIASDAKLEQVITGFQFVEGPIWHPQEKSLIFSDILGNSLYHWTEKSGTNLIKTGSFSIYCIFCRCRDWMYLAGLSASTAAS